MFYPMDIIEPKFMDAGFLCEDLDKPDYNFLDSDEVPTGTYSYKIQKIEESLVRGTRRKAYDVCYELRDNSGDTYYVRERLPVGSPRMRAFTGGLKDAGIDPRKLDAEELKTILGKTVVMYDDNGYGYFAERTYRVRTAMDLRAAAHSHLGSKRVKRSEEREKSKEIPLEEEEMDDYLTDDD